MYILQYVTLAIILNLIKLNNVKALRIHDRKFSSISMTSILHATLRVQNLKRSQEFYTNCLGVKKIAEGKDFIHLSFENSLTKNFKLVLTQSENLNIGNAYMGIGIKASEIDSIFTSVMKYGGSINTNVGNYAYGASMIPDEDEMRSTPVKYGVIQDPDGYRIEVSEVSMASVPRFFSKVVLKVLDLNDSISYYEKCGLKLLRRRSNVMNTPKEASMCAYMGDGSEDDTFIELYYPYGLDKLNLGNGFSDLTIKSHAQSDNIEPNGYKITYTS